MTLICRFQIFWIRMFESSLGTGVQQGGIWCLWTIEFIILWSHVVMAQTYCLCPLLVSYFAFYSCENTVAKAAWEEMVYLAYLSRNCRRDHGETLLSDLFCYDHVSVGGTTFNGLRPLIAITSRENALQIGLEAIWWSHFLSWDSFSKMNLVHIKLTTK